MPTLPLAPSPFHKTLTITLTYPAHYMAPIDATFVNGRWIPVYAPRDWADPDPSRHPA